MNADRIPLVPAEIDLRDFREMPLEFERLFASDSWVLATPEEKVAAMHLWCKSWHQVPAGSLPDDDRMLAHLSGTGPRWKKLRAHALRGWVMCTDGRFYHPVVAEKAIRAWDVKVAQRQRTHLARVAAMMKKVANATGHEKGLLQEALNKLLQDGPRPVTGTNGREEKGVEGKGREGNGIKQPPPNLSDAAARRAAAEERAAKTRPAREAYSKAYERRWEVEPTWDRQANSCMAQFVEKVGVDDAPGIAAFYVANSRQDYVRAKHDVTLLLRDARGLRTEWLTRRQVTDTEARQADSTAARGDQVQRLIDLSRRTG